MEENEENKFDEKNESPEESMDPTKILYEKLISEAYKYKLEERELALDRYRRADEEMESPESFVLMGKNAIDFLKQAASSSDAIANMAKEIKSIVYKEEATSGVVMNFNDNDKKAIIDLIEQEEKQKEEEKDDKNLECE